MGEAKQCDDQRGDVREAGAMSIGDVRGTVEEEGFEYAMVYYSDFAHLKDDEFHRLRKAYLEARKALSDYIGAYDG